MVSAISRTIMPYTGPSCKAVNEATEMGWVSYLSALPVQSVSDTEASLPVLGTGDKV